MTTDYEGLRREYQDIIERNEDVMLQNEKLKQIVFDKEVNFNEIEKLNNLNDDLLVQNEQLKNEVNTLFLIIFNIFERKEQFKKMLREKKDH